VAHDLEQVLVAHLAAEIRASARQAGCAPGAADIRGSAGQAGCAPGPSTARPEQPADGEVHRWPLRLGHERVAGLFHPVVQEAVRYRDVRRVEGVAGPVEEPVVAADGLDEPFAQRLPQIGGSGGGRFLDDRGERAELERWADARRAHEGAPRRGLEPLDLSRHEREDVVGDHGALHAREVPDEAAGLGVEAEQPVALERPQELADEERVGVRLVADHVGERLDARAVRVQGLGDDRRHRRGQKRRQRELERLDPRLAQRAEGGGERVCGVDLVVAVSADHAQVACIHIGEQAVEQVERRRVGPLQVVEEDDERCVLARKDGQDAPDQERQAVLRLARADRGRLWLRSYQELEVRAEVGDDPPALTERGLERVLLLDEGLGRLGQRLPHERAERLREGRQRHAPRHRVELAGREVGLARLGRAELAHER
jgi:hypothetical protein